MDVGVATPVATCASWRPEASVEPGALGQVFRLAVCAENTGEHPARLDLPEGRLLRVQGAPDAWQTVMVATGLAQRLAPGEAIQFVLRGLCTEPTKPSPYGLPLVPAGYLPSERLRAYRAQRYAGGWGVDAVTQAILAGSYRADDGSLTWELE